MRPNAPPGLNRTLELGFQRFPFGCPLTLILVGGGLLRVAIADHGKGGIAIVPIIILVVDLLMLPFGVVTALRRRMRPVALRCPQCGALSRESDRPFTVQRWPDVSYAGVACSRCGRVFTVDKYARLC